MSQPAQSPTATAAAIAALSSSTNQAINLNLLSNQESVGKIRDLLPGDTSARTDLLLNLLKSSYNTSIHSAEVRLSALTQELASVRAQNTYLESKLRSVETLAESAGKAAEEEKKRNQILVTENLRLKAENAMFKGENEQLGQFKHILVSAANGIAPAITNNANNIGLSSGLLQTQRFTSVPETQSSPSFSTADLEFKSNQPQLIGNQPTFFFSPLKQSPQESIAITNLTSHQPQSNGHPQSTPYRTSNPNYTHVAPSPLTSDALSSPAPQPAQQHQQQSAAQPANHLLQEIQANLSSSRSRPSHSPSRSSPRSHPNTTFSSLPVPVPNLVDQARSLFHTAQARLAPNVFSEFVSLVQQFRSISNGASSGSDGHSWDDIRYKAAGLLNQHQDIYILFDQLLQATQLQQQR